ncbi:hypothetical protein BHE74_00051572 [Ensete ventricosum]|nr:hypothetical protein BHE74_00051572 [Ensete ventricosum]
MQGASGCNQGLLQGAAGYGQGQPPLQGRPVASKAPLQGRPPAGATARKGRQPAGAADCGQPAWAVACVAPARDDRQRLARKKLPTVHPQGTAASGQPARGCPRRTRRGGGPLAGRLLAAMCSEAACAGAVTTAAEQEGEREG